MAFGNCFSSGFPAELCRIPVFSRRLTERRASFLSNHLGEFRTRRKAGLIFRWKPRVIFSLFYFSFPLFLVDFSWDLVQFVFQWCLAEISGDGSGRAKNSRGGHGCGCPHAFFGSLVPFSSYFFPPSLSFFLIQDSLFEVERWDYCGCCCVSSSFPCVVKGSLRVLLGVLLFSC